MMEQLSTSHKPNSVAHRYAQLETLRHPYLHRARRAAELTIPMLVPREGSNSNSEYPTPFQSVGARGVNNLASKLLLALLPPNSPFFRLSIDEPTANMVAPEARGKIEKAMSEIERTAMQTLENAAARVPVYEALRQLIVAGNALMYVPRDGDIRIFRLDRYVVKRDAMGNVLEIITKESVSPKMLPETHVALLKEQSNDSLEKSYDLYTCCRLEDGKFVIHQEVGGEPVPETFGTLPIDKCPFIPLRFTRIDGEDYGRSYIEEYFGDLASLEALTRAIVEGSAASAKVLFMVRPNGTTKIQNLSRADNGAFIQGSSDDVSVLQMQKGGDFGVAQSTAGQIQERLAFAFLLNAAVQRNAERVTAEEVRYMAQELEAALGGTYSILSQELQLPLVNLILDRLQAQGKMPSLPKDTVQPTIITGLEALGRGQDLNKLSSFLQMLQPLGAEVLSREMNIGDYIDRLGASLGIDTDGLIKSDQQKQMEQQQAQQQQQEMMMQQMMANAGEKAAPEVLKQVMQGAAKGGDKPN